jgi:hypothetical protein
LALGVVFAHTLHNVLLHVGLTADRGWWLNIIGGRAVIYFYIVSGFLISYALHEKYQPTTAGTLAFFRSRFLRIFPLWWILLIACLVIDKPPWPQGHSLEVLVPSVLFGTDWLIAFWTYPTRYWGVLPYGAGIGWTLGAELTFYLIAPWVLRSSRIALALTVASALVRLAVAILLPLDDNGLYVTWGYFFFPAMLVFFMLGHYANMISRAFPLGDDDFNCGIGFLCLFLLARSIFYRFGVVLSVVPMLRGGASGTVRSHQGQPHFQFSRRPDLSALPHAHDGRSDAILALGICQADRRITPCRRRIFRLAGNRRSFRHGRRLLHDACRRRRSAFCRRKTGTEVGNHVFPALDVRSNTRTGLVSAGSD